MRLECIAAFEILAARLQRCIAAKPCDCILLSGGVDTSVVALVAHSLGLLRYAITVYYVEGLPRDLPYAMHVSKVLGLRHRIVAVEPEDVRPLAEAAARCVARRDHIELRNDIVFLAGLLEAKRLGCRCVYTGDGGDELFGGYKFMLTLGSSELRDARIRMGVAGRYPGLELAECIGVDAYAPLLCDEVVEAALFIGEECLRVESDPWEGKRPLRWLLRAYGLHVAWRPKTPAEAGGGTEKLGARDLL